MSNQIAIRRGARSAALLAEVQAASVEVDRLEELMRHAKRNTERLMEELLRCPYDE